MLQTPPIIVKMQVPHLRQRPTICVSLVSEGKTQVRWAIIIEQKVQRCVKVNNAPPKGSPCHVLNLDEMIMKSSC